MKVLSAFTLSRSVCVWVSLCWRHLSGVITGVCRDIHKMYVRHIIIYIYIEQTLCVQKHIYRLMNSIEFVSAAGYPPNNPSGIAKHKKRATHCVNIYIYIDHQSHHISVEQWVQPSSGQGVFSLGLSRFSRDEIHPLCISFIFTHRWYIYRGLMCVFYRLFLYSIFDLFSLRSAMR